jgi:hypothetical protein
MAGLAVTVTDDGNYSQDDLYNAIRNADKAGDTQAVKALIAHLQGGGAPAGVQQPAAPVAPPAPATLSGMTPDQLHAKYDNMPWIAKPGIQDVVTHSASAGLDAEANGAVNAIGSAIMHPIDAYNSGGATIGNAYQKGRSDVLSGVDYARLNSPTSSAIGDIGGALLTPMGEAKTFGQMAVAGAGYMGARGFADTNGSLIDRGGAALKDAAIGAVATPVLGFAGGKVANAFAPKAAEAAADVAAPVSINALNPGQEVAQAAQRQGVNVMAADVGGPVTRRLTSGLAQTPLGVGPITEAAGNTVNSFGAARDRIAAMAGQATDSAGAGEAAISGAKSYIETSGDQGGRLFDAALKDVPAGTPVVVDNTIAATRKTLTSLQSTPEIANILQSPALKNFGDALTSDSASANGSIPLQAARDLRTAVGKAMDNTSLTDDLKSADLKNVYRSLSGDIERAVTTASATGAAPSGAVTRLTAANKFWSNRADTVDNVLGTVLGNDGLKGGQPAFEAIQRLAGDKGGDPAKLKTLMATMPDDQAGTIRATIIGKLGKSNAGTQDATGDAFSPSQFVTHWNSLSPKAKDVMFTPELRSALDDLATVGSGIKQSMKYANHSNSGGAMAVGNLISTGAAGIGGVGALVGHPAIAATAVIGLAAQYGGARFLASPMAVRMLTRVASAPTTQAQAAAVAGMTTLAAKIPQMSDGITRLQQVFSSKLTQTMPAMGLVAASPNAGPNQKQ